MVIKALKTLDKKTNSLDFQKAPKEIEFVNNAV